MEGNRDESEKCIKLAQHHLRNGNINKACKFLDKAEKLYPSSTAKELLIQISNMKNNSSNGTANQEQDSSTGSSTYARQRHTQSSSSSTSNEAKEPSYTTEQLASVKKIRKCKDYYEILGVSKDCTEDDLKKAYRKLALKMHPDKNHAPGSTEAFKAISNAFSVLSNPTKRQRYDQFGSEAESSTTTHHHYDDYTRGFEGDISAEELFNMFFGGGFTTGRPVYRQRRHHHYHHTTNQSESSYTALLQLAPILFMVVLTLLSSFLVSDNVYSLERSQKYPHERKTQQLGVPYYVKGDFHQEYKGSIRNLERHVEDDYLANLRTNCFRERSYKENMLWRARGDSKLYERAQNIKTPACDRLEAIYS